MPLRLAALCCAVLGTLILSGCDAVPTPEDPLSDAPRVSDLIYSPEAVLGNDPPGSQGPLSVPVDVSVHVESVRGGLREVVYVIQPPNPADLPIAVGRLTSDGSDRYAASLTAELPRGVVGKYALVVYAVSRAGRTSNILRGHINYVAVGGPPVIVEVIADPDTVFVSRHNTLVLTAVVTDPDGLDNVSRVVVRTPRGDELPMSDDGVSRGDPIAGDGRYTATFENVNQATPNTTQVFSFQAFDRTGLASEIVEKAIRIEE